MEWNPLEQLREELRIQYRLLRSQGVDDARARTTLGERYELLARMDALAGSAGDPLAGTDEADWT